MWAGRPADSAGGSTAASKSTTLGNFYHLPPYLKLYDVLKATHANYKVRTRTEATTCKFLLHEWQLARVVQIIVYYYLLLFKSIKVFCIISKVTLDLHSSQEKFGSFLRAALDVLSQLLELATLHDIGKVKIIISVWTFTVLIFSIFNIESVYIRDDRRCTCNVCSLWQCVEEILGYLKSCFSREPTMATVCVQQVSRLLPCHVRCGSPYGFSTEQCATTVMTPRRLRLVPADRACKGIGFPVRWFHTFILWPQSPSPT